MMRSMFSGVSGLQAQQTAMDVIGNNIANVNTAGYKAAQINFQDILNQTIQGASAPQGTLGGTNPMQVGLGTKVSSITTVFTPGSFQSTGVNTDLAINDDGFFVVSNGSNQYFTRAGAFIFDAQGNLVDSGSGYQVQGWMRDPNTGVINTNAPTTSINIPKGVTMPANVSTKQTYTGNLSAADLEGGSTQTSGKIYDSLGNSHDVYTTYYKMDNASDTWLVNVNVPDLGVTNNYELSFNSNGKFSNLVSITPKTPGTVTSSLTPNAGMQMDTAAASVHNQTYTVDALDGTAHTINIKYTQTSATTWTWAATDTTAGGAAAGNGTVTWNGSTYTGLGPITVDGAQVSIATPVGAAAPGAASFSAAAAATDGPLSAQTISNFQMDTTNVQSQEYTVFDAAGKMHVLQMTITPANPGTTVGTPASPITWNYTVTDKSDASINIPGGTISYDGTNYSGFPSSLSVNGTTLGFTVTPGGVQAPASGQFQASATQPFTTLTTASSLALNPPGANAMSVALDLSGLTQYQTADNAKVPTTDGYAAGTLTGTTFDSSGTIVGTFDNGLTLNLGQVALASFNNPSGLTKVGNTMFSVSNNSGGANIGIAGSGGRGTISASELEQSNVDLAQEFSNMIVTERAFQANSKIITTSDEMLQTLTDLKR